MTAVVATNLMIAYFCGNVNQGLIHKGFESGSKVFRPIERFLNVCQAIFERQSDMMIGSDDLCQVVWFARGGQ